MWVFAVRSVLTWHVAYLQVMKMVMTLNVQDSGCVHFIKRPGAVLESGCVVARLELDDPSRLHPASLQCSEELGQL